MSPHYMSVFAGGRRVNLNLFAVYICTWLHNPLLKYHQEGSCLQAILFQICYEYNVRRLNNILINGHLHDTDIRLCIYCTITQF